MVPKTPIRVITTSIRSHPAKTMKFPHRPCKKTQSPPVASAQQRGLYICARTSKCGIIFICAAIAPYSAHYASQTPLPHIECTALYGYHHPIFDARRPPTPPKLPVVSKAPPSYPKNFRRFQKTLVISRRLIPTTQTSPRSKQGNAAAFWLPSPPTPTVPKTQPPLSLPEDDG